MTIFLRFLRENPVKSSLLLLKRLLYYVKSVKRLEWLKNNTLLSIKEAIPNTFSFSGVVRGGVLGSNMFSTARKYMENIPENRSKKIHLRFEMLFL